MILGMVKSKWSILLFSLFLSFSLFLPFFVTEVEAATAGPRSTPEQCVELIPNSGNASFGLNLWKSKGFDEGNYYYLFCYYPQDSVYKDMCCISCSCRFIYYGGHFYTVEPNATFHYNTFGTNYRDNSVITYNSTNTATMLYNLPYYRLNDSSPSFPYYYFYNQGTLWANFTLIDGATNTVICDHNLDASEYEPDYRTLIVSLTAPDEIGSDGAYWINVNTDAPYLEFGAFCSVNVSIGGETYNFPFTLGEYLNTHLIDDGSPPMWSFRLDPLDITSYEFTLNSLTYYSPSDWGTKTVLVGADIGGDEFEAATGWDSITYFTNQYFNSFPLNSDLQMYSGGLYTCTFDNLPYYFDSQYSTFQNFYIRSILLPDFVSSAQLSTDTLFKLFESYDLIMVNCSNSNLFDSFYSDTSYSVLQNTFSPDDAVTEIMTCTPRYKNFPIGFDITQIQGGYSDLNVGFIFTRSFYLKQVYSYMGDIDDRLLEFEVSLVGEDGSLPSIEKKLVNIYGSMMEYFNSVAPNMQKLVNSLNSDASDSIKGLLSSVVSKLGILQDIYNALTAEFDFDLDGLEHPWVDFYELIKGVFDDSQRMMESLSRSISSLTSGDTTMTSLPYSVPSVTPALPFYPSVTPIPIPTISGGG